MTLEQLTALCNAGFTKADIANFIQPQPQTQMNQPQTQMVQPQTQMVQPQTQMMQTPQPQMMQTPQPQMMQTPQPTNNQSIDLQLLDIIKHIQNDNLANASSSKPENAVDIGLSILGNKVNNDGK